MAEVVSQIEELDESAKDLRKKEELAKRRLVAVDRMLTRIANLTTTVDEFYRQSSEDATLLDVDPKQLVRVDADVAKLQAIRERVEQEIDALGDALNEEREGSDARKRNEASNRAEELRKKLAEPQRRHQEYRRALAHWDAQQAEILGSAKEPKSVKGLEARIAELETLPSVATTKRNERDELVGEIFAAKSTPTRVDQEARFLKCRERC